MAFDVLGLTMGRPMGSALWTTVGAAALALDSPTILARAVLHPLAFGVSAAAGVIFATVSFSTMSQDRTWTEPATPYGSRKHLILGMLSLTVGMIPSLLSKVAAVAGRIFCGPLIGGFRMGFMATQTILQGIETYPLLKFTSPAPK